MSDPCNKIFAQKRQFTYSNTKPCDVWSVIILEMVGIATQKRLLISKYTCIMYSEKLNLSLNFVLLEDETGDSSKSEWHF